MEEARRQAYLRAMGVQVYFPRITLAGAKASPKYDLSSETDRSDVLLESPVSHARRSDEPSAIDGFECAFIAPRATAFS